MFPSRIQWLRCLHFFLLALLLSVPSVNAQELKPQEIVKRSRMLMGTLVFVTVVAPDLQTAQTAATAGLDEIRRLEKLLSTWIPSSDMSRINREAGGTPIRISPESFELLQRSLEIGEFTKGGFNIAIGPAVREWGFPEHPRMADPDRLEAMRPLLDIKKVRFDPNDSTVLLRDKGMWVDIGGIGKGFAADKAVEVMRHMGATAGVVALSGDIKTFGHLPDGEQFVFGIQHPRDPEQLLGTIQLENEAVSTAGDYQQYFFHEGARYHHILDPETLYPARDCQSVTVVARDGVWADGLDTGIFVMGGKKGMDLIERLPDVEGVIVNREGRVLISSGLQNRFMPIAH